MQFDNCNDLLKSITNEHELIGILPIAKLDFTARNTKKFFLRLLKATFTGIAILLASIITGIIPLELLIAIFPILMIWIFWKPKQAKIAANALIISKSDIKLVQVTMTSTGYSIYHTYEIDYTGKRIADVIKIGLNAYNRLQHDFWIKLEGYFVKASIDYNNGQISIRNFKYRVLGEEDVVGMMKVQLKLKS